MNVWHYAMNQLMSNIAQKIKVKTSRNSNNKKTTADWSWFIENMSWIRTCHLSTKIQLVLADIGSSHASVYILCLSSTIARLRRLWLVMLNHECKQSESNKIHAYSRCLNDPTKHFCIKTRSLNCSSRNSLSIRVIRDLYTWTLLLIRYALTAIGMSLSL